MFTIENMNPLFEFVERLKGVEQGDIHHPEGDVLNHTLQVTSIAFRESYDVDLILAAMLHDIGKYENFKGHENVAVEWLEPYCSKKTIWLIKNHMRIWLYITGEMKKLSKCKYLVEHGWLPELIQLARFDKAGRNPRVKKVLDKQMIVDRLNNIILFKEKEEFKFEDINF